MENTGKMRFAGMWENWTLANYCKIINAGRICIVGKFAELFDRSSGCSLSPKRDSCFKPVAVVLRGLTLASLTLYHE